jgi:hypothetical protein
MQLLNWTLSINIPLNWVENLRQTLEKRAFVLISFLLLALSITAFVYFLNSGLSLSYNDARSHLDIGRRVVEGLKPGLAQLGSVWLPLPHILMIPTIWNDFFWHTGLAGALQSMISYIAIGLLIYLYLKELGAGLAGRIVGVLIFALNLNVLYLQSTAMTELLLMATTMAASFYLLHFFKSEKMIDLVKSAFWVMLATLARYDGWFLFAMSLAVLGFYIYKRKGFKNAEGALILYSTLAGLGIFLWFAWNELIFKDPLYFAFGPYSAHAQQESIAAAGQLATKGNIIFSIRTYFYALFYNTNTFIAVLGFIGAIWYWFNHKISLNYKLATFILAAPLLFNVIALYLGHSVLFIQGISGDTWFNVRYGVVVIPFMAVFIGLLFDKLKNFRMVLTGVLLFMLFFQFHSFDAVTIDDARVGASSKNVYEVSNWLNQNTKSKPGFVLISAASHDAIIFSSGLPMSKYIHEGTGKYWEQATVNPDHWAKWIIMRTNDDNDQTWRLVHNTPGFQKYQLVEHFPFADIYQLKDQYFNDAETKPIILNQK